MIGEPDTARFNKLTESVGSYRVSDGELDKVRRTSLAKRVNAMRAATEHWIIVVSATLKRPRLWWLHSLMHHFREGISVMDMPDGRLAFCTWAVAGGASGESIASVRH